MLYKVEASSAPCYGLLCGTHMHMGFHNQVRKSTTNDVVLVINKIVMLLSTRARHNTFTTNTTDHVVLGIENREGSHAVWAGPSSMSIRLLQGETPSVI